MELQRVGQRKTSLRTLSIDPLVEHLESAVGRIESGWRPSESADGITVVRILDQPHDGVSTYATLGLSRNALVMSDGRTVREELVFAASDRFDSGAVASFLQTLAEFVLGKNQALLRGEVIGPSEPVIPGTQLNAVYAAIPVLHRETLWTFQETEPPTVFVWVVPLHGQEAAHIRLHGWDAFEDRIETADVDLCDLDRGSVV